MMVLLKPAEVANRARSASPWGREVTRVRISRTESMLRWLCIIWPAAVWNCRLRTPTACSLARCRGRERRPCMGAGG